jgi:polyisoprenoid-binding protein YceI
MKMKSIWLLALAFLFSPAQAENWKVDAAKSQISFVIKQMNVPVEGGFSRYVVQAVFDPAKPEAGQFKVELDIASIETGSEEGNGEARRPAWFDTARFPKASFVSKSIKKEGAGRYTATGEFTMKGRTRPLIVPFNLTPQRDGGWLASGRVALKRTEYNIGGGEWADPSVVAEDIDARFKLLLKP